MVWFWLFVTALFFSVMVGQQLSHPVFIYMMIDDIIEGKPNLSKTCSMR